MSWRVDLDNPPDEARPYVELYELSQKRIAELEKRRDELLALISRLSQEMPLQDEVNQAIGQRGVLLAEIGTLRSRIRELESTQPEHHPAEASMELLTWPKYEPPVYCEHRYLTATIMDGVVVGQNCNECWIPVGVPCDPEPANDCVLSAVEAQAALLASTKNWAVFKNRNKHMAGFRAWLEDEDIINDDPDFLAGWLAGRIYTHDSE